MDKQVDLSVITFSNTCLVIVDELVGIGLKDAKKKFFSCDKINSLNAFTEKKKRRRRNYYRLQIYLINCDFNRKLTYSIVEVSSPVDIK